MAVMTIAICDEIRKDAQKLYRQLSTLVPDAELLLYRTRESLLKGLAEGHKICDLIFLGLDGVKPVESGELEHVLVHILEVCRREGGRALYFRYRTRVYTLQHDHLAYISSSLHSVTFHLTDGKRISCRARLGDFSGQLSDSSFLRCHQSFCINMEKVTSLKKNSFVVGQTEIPISRTYLKTARKKYKDYLAEQKVCS